MSEIKPMRLSPTGILDWETCPRLWAMKRLFALSGEPSGHLAVGTALHNAVKAALRQGERDVQQLFRAYVDLYQRIASWDGLEREKVVSGIEKCLQKIDLTRYAGSEVEGCKTLSISDDVVLWGYIDLITPSGKVVEWKTTGSEKKRANHKFQIKCYQLLAHSEEAEIIYLNWKSGKVRTERYGPLCCEEKDSLMLRILSTANEVCDAIRKGVFPETGHCDWCSVSAECKRREW